MNTQTVSAPATTGPHLFQVLPAPRELPPRPGEAELVELYDSGAFGPAGSNRAGVRVQSNMVMSFDGAIAGSDGSSKSVSTPADMRIFSVVRSLADVVITGANTARTEKITRLSPKPSHADQRSARGQATTPTLALISGSGAIDFDVVNARGSGQLIVFTSTIETAALNLLRTHADEVVVLETLTPETIMAELIARGHRRIVCEGGPNVLGQWVGAGWVDEMCLTISPQLTGFPGLANPQFGSGTTHTEPVFRNLLGRTHLAQPVRVEPLSLVTDGASMMYRLSVTH